MSNMYCLEFDTPKLLRGRESRGTIHLDVSNTVGSEYLELHDTGMIGTPILYFADARVDGIHVTALDDFVPIATQLSQSRHIVTLAPEVIYEYVESGGDLERDGVARADQYPVDWDWRRMKVYEDADGCDECGSTRRQLHAHHTTPVSAGGSHSLDNLSCVCSKCHSQSHQHRIAD